MTKTHCFCAIRGAPTGLVELNPLSPDSYSLHLVPDGTIQWLADVELLLDADIHW